MMIKRNVIILLSVLLLADIAYSFNQHYHTTLDGDMAWIVVPATGYQHLMNDPLGLSALLKNEVYASPNRYWAHWSMMQYFKHSPRWFHSLTDPISSVYLACAFAKTMIQVFIIAMIAAFVCIVLGFAWEKFLGAALIISPLFQAAGYNDTMGIIDLSVTYTFFYALPIGLLMLFFYPFYKAEKDGTEVHFSILQKITLLLLVLFLFLNGPLIPGIVLLVCPSVILYKWFQYFRNNPGSSAAQRAILALNKIPRALLFYFVLFSLLCLYSLYIGKYNAENSSAISLLERYQRLPRGLFEIFTHQFGFPLLLLAISFNLSLLYKKSKEGLATRQFLTIVKWIGIVAAIYILILPLGGYRPYRPYIIRRDTFMPITISLIFMYGLTSYYLITQLSSKYKLMYAAILLIVSAIFTIADKPIHNNWCEKQGLEKISSSSEKIIPLDCGCTIMSWEKITNYDDSKWNTQLLQTWGIIKEQKFYYQK